ncbi:MAG: YwaF family protein, partial [Acholeplasmataceae bacterium]|nr:YwaF family protein [Acholeplasmataceae bacterium]
MWPNIDYGNSSYFLYFAFLVGVTAGLYFFLKKRSERFRWVALFLIVLSAFLLHFLKIWMITDYRNNLPYSYSYMTMDNICAVNAILFPFIFLSKSKLLKDYMVILGILSGLMAFIIPIDGFNNQPFDPKVIRFYYSHYVIFAVPFLMGALKVHRIDIRRILVLPLIVFGVMGLVLVNEIFLNLVGIIDTTFTNYYSGEFRNQAFVFGIPEVLSGFKAIVYPMTPKIFLT